MSWQLDLPEPEATDRLGRLLARTLPGSAVVYLSGDLGAGKSSLARALLRELGVAGPVKSPTYTLIERYDLAEGRAAHLDLYRIAEAAELEFLGLEDLAADTRLWLVEWPERGGASLPRPDLEIHLQVQDFGRGAIVTGSSPAGHAWVETAAKMAALSTSS